MVIQITDATLDKVLKTDKPVVIDFWAEWCGPCRMVAPIIEQLAEEYKDNVIVGKIDVDENNEAITKYGIRNIPTILFIKKGQVMDKIVGTADKRLFVDKINKLLKTK
jgi:thioredoxin 1